MRRKVHAKVTERINVFRGSDSSQSVPCEVYELRVSTACRDRQFGILARSRASGAASRGGGKEIGRKVRDTLPRPQTKALPEVIDLSSLAAREKQIIKKMFSFPAYYAQNFFF